MKLTDEGQKHYDAFMTAVRGIPAHVVARHACTQTPGLDWRRTPKGRIAGYYANAKAPEDIVVFPQMKHFDLDKLVAQCKKEI